MIKRKYDDFSINKSKNLFSNKRTKIYESKYITIDMNEKMFNNYSIDELNEIVNEIDILIEQLNNYKEKINNIISIYM